ncbi:hypothetical protein BOTNAR_0104g00120 [Botryotinia narcissicola]|uniref:Uncharacterized protein n=1 Tax=Botryotinia narcissicola TaxID=278944 RepID=A0A4Z1IR68_9HELO|nr:hypothetical protein BOTNAR_0104g00120 [Botryotinia narcissicola]
MPTMWLSDSQKIGVAFCSGGGFFLIGGVMMFFDRAMLAMGNVRILWTLKQDFLAYNMSM